MDNVNKIRKWEPIRRHHLVDTNNISECALTLTHEWSDKSVNRDGRARHFVVSVTDTQLDLEPERKSIGFDLESRERQHPPPPAALRPGVCRPSKAKKAKCTWTISQLCWFPHISFILFSFFWLSRQGLQQLVNVVPIVHSPTEERWILK